MIKLVYSCIARRWQYKEIIYDWNIIMTTQRIVLQERVLVFRVQMYWVHFTEPLNHMQQKLWQRVRPFLYVEILKVIGNPLKTTRSCRLMPRKSSYSCLYVFLILLLHGHFNAWKAKNKYFIVCYLGNCQKIKEIFTFWTKKCSKNTL